MAGRMSKNKGKAGERELCKILAEYLGEGFSRSMQSGAYIGKSNSYRKENLGETAIRAMKADLITPDHLPKLVIESKSYKDLPMHNLMRQGVPQMDEWITDLENDCDDGDFPFLAVKLNRKGWIVAVRIDSLDEITVDNYVKYGEYIVADLHGFMEKYKDYLLKACS